MLEFERRQTIPEQYCVSEKGGIKGVLILQGGQSADVWSYIT
jgi:hypothetical protein